MPVLHDPIAFAIYNSSYNKTWALYECASNFILFAKLRFELERQTVPRDARDGIEYWSSIDALCDLLIKRGQANNLFGRIDT